MKKLLFLIVIILISCSSTKNITVKNRTKVDEVHNENQEIKEEITSLKREIQRLSEQQRENSYIQRKRNNYPENLSIWIKIKNGKIHSNGINHYNLPGQIVFDTIKKTLNAQSIVYLKSTHTDARWYFYLPRKDGEYTITAYLVE